MTAAQWSQRLRRADFIDGLGLYVGPAAVAMAAVRKRLFRVSLRQTAVLPLPERGEGTARFQALTEAVAGFVREHGIDASRTFLSLPRREAAFNRVILPAAARENLSQVLEYELENLIPLPKEDVYYDYSTRSLGEERIEVLLMCIPRRVVHGYLEALARAEVRPRGIVLASTAVADFLAFCRGESEDPLGLLVQENGATEVALLAGGRLVASQLLPDHRTGGPQAVLRALQRQLADEALAGEALALFRWQSTNGAAPAELPGETALVELARGRLEAPEEFFSGAATAILPALGAALEAVREGTIPVNLLPPEERRGTDEGLSITTVVLVALTALLLLVWGASALTKDLTLRRQVRAQLESVEPQVREVRILQSEIERLQKELDILSAGQEPVVTPLLQQLTELIPADAYLTTLTLRGGKLTLDGQARSASDVLTALERSKRFRSVNFSSPTTKAGDKERFSLVAELAP